PRPLPPGAFPVVLGNGVGGAVVAIGRGVDRAWLGTRVVTTTGGSGGYASRAVAAVDELHRVPVGLDTSTAVALLADGRTALGLVRAAQIREGETAAVTAAGGGVGSLLVQLAGHTGAMVVALAGDERKLTHARGLGADLSINYRDDDWPDQLDMILGGRRTLDIVFDGVGGAVSAPLTARLGPGGRYLPHGTASGTWGDIDAAGLAARRITTIPLTAIASEPRDLYDLVEEALRRAADGTLRPTIGQTFPLERAADAHVAMEARLALGKTLLVP